LSIRRAEQGLRSQTGEEVTAKLEPERGVQTKSEKTKGKDKIPPLYDPSRSLKTRRRQLPQGTRKRIHGDSEVRIAEEQVRELGKALLDLAEMYPNAPSQLFTEPERTIESQQINSCDIEKSSTVWDDGSKHGCTYIASGISSERWAPTADTASRLAAGHLIIKLHEKGLLKDLWVSHIDESHEENGFRTTIEFVYTSCAQILAIPQIAVRKLPGFKDQRTEVSIQVPEYGISVTSKGLSPREAEAAACLRFMAAFD